MWMDGCEHGSIGTSSYVTLHKKPMLPATQMENGHAIAQVVSYLLPTEAAWVWSCGIGGGQSGAVAGFLQVLRFPLPIFLPPTAPQSP
jgi:hypothetical protein